ncbi:hypothetical protein ABIF73_006344 [Bradyrhizobium japonicum]|uniref:TetR/AcrR family transcriptional regulator C-terminal domain-containing protein n=1 Tax=Bradyrhizobium japonicum TaxID=375 RepID=UPI003391FE7F
MAAPRCASSHGASASARAAFTITSPGRPRSSKRSSPSTARPVRRAGVEEPRYKQLARQPAAFCRQFALDLVEQWSDPREHQFQKVITAERNRVPGIRAKFADHFYAREQSMMTDYFRGFALAGLVSTPDPRETARLFAAGLIYIRLEHYVMGAAPSPRSKVVEAIDRYLAFFLSLIAADGGTSDNKKRNPKGETRGKAAPD